MIHKEFSSSLIHWRWNNVEFTERRGKLRSMVRTRREEEGGRRAAATEGEENHYCQLRQVNEGGGEGVYSNIEVDQHEADEGRGGGRGHNMKILSALPPGCVLFVPRDAQMVGTQVLPCTIVPRDQVFKMIRANRNNQRRAQRRPEHSKDDEEVVIEVVEENGKDHDVGRETDEHHVEVLLHAGRIESMNQISRKARRTGQKKLCKNNLLERLRAFMEVILILHPLVTRAEHQQKTMETRKVQKSGR